MNRDMRDAHETARARDERDFLLSLGPEDARKWRVAQEVVARTVEFVRSAAFPGETTSADAHATTQARDAAWMLAALDGTGEPRTRTHSINPETGEFTPLDFHREWLNVMDTQHPHTPQENDMPNNQRRHREQMGVLDQIHDTLTEIRDRLPELTSGWFRNDDPEGLEREREAVRAAHEPAAITEEPPVGSQVTDCDDNVWERVSADAYGWRNRSLPASAPLNACSWATVNAPDYRPLRPTTDAGRERVGLPVESAPADVDPDEGQPLWRLRSRLRGATRYIEKLEADFARVTKERDEARARHAALRADVDEFQYRHRGHPSTWELVDALGRDTERAES